MEKKVNFTPDDILRKKFPRNVKGYDPFEVDTFLDKVIADYQTYEATIAGLETQIANLSSESGNFNAEKETLIRNIDKIREEKRELEVKIASLENRIGGIRKSDAPTAENLKLLKRLRSLEEFLYSHGYNPNEIASGIVK